MKSLQITAAFLKSSIEAIEPVLDINHCTYGFLLKIDNGNEIYISLDKVKKEFSPLDIERMITEAKTVFGEVYFIGVDKAAPDSDMTVYHVKDGAEVAA
jgi:hypothetical protein